MNKAFCPHCNKEVSYHIIEETIKEYKGYQSRYITKYRCM